MIESSKVFQCLIFQHYNLSFVLYRYFVLNFSTFCNRRAVVTKLLVPSILLSTSPIFVLRIVVVNKPLMWGILFSTSLIFSPNFVYLCCIRFSEFYLFSKLFISIFTLLYTVFHNFFTHYITYFFKSTWPVCNL